MNNIKAKFVTIGNASTALRSTVARPAAGGLAAAAAYDPRFFAADPNNQVQHEILQFASGAQQTFLSQAITSAYRRDAVFGPVLVRVQRDATGLLNGPAGQVLDLRDADSDAEFVVWSFLIAAAVFEDVHKRAQSPFRLEDLIYLVQAPLAELNRILSEDTGLESLRMPPTILAMTSLLYVEYRQDLQKVSHDALVRVVAGQDIRADFRQAVTEHPNPNTPPPTPSHNSVHLEGRGGGRGGRGGSGHVRYRDQTDVGGGPSQPFHVSRLIIVPGAPQGPSDSCCLKDHRAHNNRDCRIQTSFRKDIESNTRIIASKGRTPPAVDTTTASLVEMIKVWYDQQPLIA